MAWEYCRQSRSVSRNAGALLNAFPLRELDGSDAEHGNDKTVH